MSSPQVTWDEPGQQAAPLQIKWDDEQQQPRLPLGEVPLTSHLAATEQGFANIGKGVIDAGAGLYNTVRHPIDTAKSMIAAPGNFVRQLGQVPGAIRDINASQDPTDYYLKAAGETAGEGAGQAIVAAAMPEIGRAGKSLLTPKPKPVFPGANLPESPDPALLQARSLERGPVTELEPAAGLGRIPAAAPEGSGASSNFPPDEPTGRFSIPGPSAPNPARADLLEDQGVQQNMRDYLDKQEKQVYAHEPLGKSKGELIEDARQAQGKPTPPVKYTKTPGVKANSPASKPSVAMPASADLTPEWQAELDRVKVLKARK